MLVGASQNRDRLPGTAVAGVHRDRDPALVLLVVHVNRREKRHEREREQQEGQQATAHDQASVTGGAVAIKFLDALQIP